VGNKTSRSIHLTYVVNTNLIIRPHKMLLNGITMVLQLLWLGNKSCTGACNFWNV